MQNGRKAALNPFEMSMIVVLPTIALLSILITAMLKSQLKGYTLIASSVFLAWVLVSIVASGLLGIATPMGRMAWVAFFILAIIVFVIRAIRYGLSQQRNARNGDRVT